MTFLAIFAASFLIVYVSASYGARIARREIALDARVRDLARKYETGRS